jgi:hypothetical protein
VDTGVGEITEEPETILPNSTQEGTSTLFEEVRSSMCRMTQMTSSFPMLSIAVVFQRSRRCNELPWSHVGSGNTNIRDLMQISAEGMNSDGVWLEPQARLCIPAENPKTLQQAADEYDACYSPTSNFTLIQTIITMVTQEGMELKHSDIQEAFLTANLDTEVFVVSLPPWLLAFRGKMPLKKVTRWFKTIKQC